MNAAPPSAWQIQNIVSLARQTLASLREDHGQVLEEDDEALAALAAEGVDAAAVLSRLGRAVLDANAWVEAVNARIDYLCARRDRARHREEVLRQTLLTALQAVGMNSYKDAEFTASVLPGKAKVIVTDASKLPDSVVRTETVRTPDRAAILKTLLGDNTDPMFAEVTSGATLSNPVPYLTMRAK